MQSQNELQDPSLSRTATFLAELRDHGIQNPVLRRFFLSESQDFGTNQDNDRNIVIAREVQNEVSPEHRHIYRDCLISSAISNSASIGAYLSGASPELYILVGFGASCVSNEGFALYRFCNGSIENDQVSSDNQSPSSQAFQTPANINSMSDNSGDTRNISSSNLTPIQRYTTNPDTGRRFLLASTSAMTSMIAVNAQCPNELNRVLLNSGCKICFDSINNSFCYISGNGHYRQRLFAIRGGSGNFYGVLANSRRNQDLTTRQNFDVSATIEPFAYFQRPVLIEPVDSTSVVISPRRSIRKEDVRSVESNSPRSVNSMG